MGRLLSILFLTVTLSANATDYWISWAIGSDAYKGTNASEPWQSFKNINHGSGTNILSGATSDTVHVDVTNTFDGAISFW